MGCFYTGFDYKNRKNGYFKIGETGGKSPSVRLAAIRRTDSFQCLGYLILQEETKSERLYVESYTRMMMEKHPALTHTQNDHFLYTIESKEKKYEQAQEFANLALQYAKEACQLAGVKCKVGKRVYKRS